MQVADADQASSTSALEASNQQLHEALQERTQQLEEATQELQQLLERKGPFHAQIWPQPTPRRRRQPSCPAVPPPDDETRLRTRWTRKPCASSSAAC